MILLYISGFVSTLILTMLIPAKPEYKCSDPIDQGIERFCMALVWPVTLTVAGFLCLAKIIGSIN